MVRATQPPDRFHEIKDLIASFDRDGINFNWHLWPSAHPALERYLIDEVGMKLIGRGDFLMKSISPEGSGETRSPAVPLQPTMVEPYVDGKMAGWGNESARRPEIAAATRRALSDPRNLTLVRIEDGRVSCAASSFSEGCSAYLRGDFVVPEFRGRGLYREMISFREAFLAGRGVKAVTAIADQETSSPIFRKLAYLKAGEIVILARRPSRWVSL